MRKQITLAGLALGALALNALTYSPRPNTVDLVTYADNGTPSMVARAMPSKSDCMALLATYAGHVARVECIPTHMTLAHTGL